MKKAYFIVFCVLVFGCSGNDDNSNANCNFLINAGVNLEVNLNLPQFNSLNFPSNSVYVSNQGINGVWLWSVNSGTFTAWEATDPAHAVSSCSLLTETATGMVECGCNEANSYNLINGLPQSGNTQPCTLRPYRVENLGNNVYLVSN